ncbi:hypothetical protein Hs30E_17600 [Lactococcus hodotermopsidis]|uniref:Uncharacterized protein n=1 Tax=Pseudolactococcus hodotermopsidis TaxID=2709157 RepID=A0A6A0BCQ7_9LACT|nr:hypothetical protein Hs30E_17600 [Lactococcus hodotermopsidis]
MDASSAPERLTTILEIAKPTAIVAISALPINVSQVPIISAERLHEKMRQSASYELTHMVTGGR